MFRQSNPAFHYAEAALVMWRTQVGVSCYLPTFYSLDIIFPRQGIYTMGKSPTLVLGRAKEHPVLYVLKGVLNWKQEKCKQSKLLEKCDIMVDRRRSICFPS